LLQLDHVYRAKLSTDPTGIFGQESSGNSTCALALATSRQAIAQSFGPANDENLNQSICRAVYEVVPLANHSKIAGCPLQGLDKKRKRKETD